MSLTKAKEFREKRVKLVEQMQEITKSAAAEDRVMSPEEDTKWEKMREDSQALLKSAERFEEQVKMLSDSDEVRKQIEEHEHSELAKKGEKAITREDRELAFRAWAIAAEGGVEMVPDSFRTAADKCGERLGGSERTLKLMRSPPRTHSQLQKLKDELVYRATTAQTITTTGGGHTANSEIVNTLEVQLKEFGGVREVATQMRTDHGNSILMPTVDDTGNVATILAINTAATNKSLVFGQVSLVVFKYTSGIVLVPMELLQDTAVDLIGYIGEALGMRIARGLNAHFTTGSTTGGTPRGIVSEAPSVTALTTADAMTYALMKDMEHNVDPSYRRNASWMMHDGIKKLVEKVVDSNGQPIFRAANEVGTSDRIFGYPSITNQDMVSTTTGVSSKVAIFGDFSKYIVRDVQDIQLLRLNERYADAAQTAWLTFSRHGGRALFATTTAARKPWGAMFTTT